MQTLIIFGAKYLWIGSVAIAAYALYKSDAKSKIVRTAAFVLPIAYIAGVIARMSYYNPRPFMVSGVEPLIEHVADNGFPSDHTLLVAALASVVTIYSRKLGVVMWVMALLVASSRVLAGVHHVLDVAASILISAIVALVVYFLSNSKHNAPNSTTATE
jgi:undecaprenyl-diphosphatase